MSAAFGGPVAIESGVAGDGISLFTPAEDMERVRLLLGALQPGDTGLLRIYRPRPTAAFAPRDAALAGHGAALAALAARGFAAVERRTGGQLAIYDENALVIDLVAPHAEPRHHVLERFGGFAAAVAAALCDLGIDARVGAVPGEYCPGDYSVNAQGRVKLAGIAQRVGRGGYHLGAVISVQPAGAVRDAVAEAYALLGMPFDAASFGAAGIGFGGLAAALPNHLRALLPVR